METKQPLLSICIPTYNRANVLKDNLDSLVRTEGFSDEVEVIISDNCSTDETKQIGKFFSEKYSNIKFFRNDCNVGAEQNVLFALERGTGLFLKLINDYSFFYKDGLSFLLKKIKDNIADRPNFYFHYEYGSRKPDTIIITDINEIVIKEGSKLGWLSNFGFWREDFLALDDKTYKIESKFPQIVWLFRLYKNNKKILYCQKKLLLRKDITEKYKLIKENYNYIKVHGENYINLLKDYASDGILDENVIETVKRTLIYPFTYMILLIKIAHHNPYSYKVDDAKMILESEFATYRWYKKELIKSTIRASIVILIQRFLHVSRLDQILDLERIYLFCKNILCYSRIPK